MRNTRLWIVMLTGLISVALARQSSGIGIIRAGATPATIAPAENFTGTVHLEAQFRHGPPSRVGGAIVRFEPGARTAWHVHPLGQTLFVTAGAGFIQHWGGPRQEIRTGDIVWTAPGVKHWHGAADSTGMTHLAISEALDGKSVDWMEKVSEQQYRSAQ